MGTKLLKTVILAAVLIFLFSNASWADVHNRHLRSDNDRIVKYRRPAHFAKPEYHEYHYKNYRPEAVDHRGHRKKIVKHQPNHRPSFKIFSIGSLFKPEWSLIIKTKSRW
jgi:hypothetical protein